MIHVKVSGSFKNMEQFAQRIKRREQFKAIEKFGEDGVRALQAATPKDSSRTANSWYYTTTDRPGYFAINWANSDVEGGAPVAVLNQYGHATKNGGYVQGVDYINPALKPIFDKIANEMWKVVTK